MVGNLETTITISSQRKGVTVAAFINIGGAFVRREDVRFVYERGPDTQAEYFPGGDLPVLSIVVLNDGKRIAAQKSAKEITETLLDADNRGW